MPQKHNISCFSGLPENWLNIRHLWFNIHDGRSLAVGMAFASRLYLSNSYTPSVNLSTYAWRGNSTSWIVIDFAGLPSSEYLIENRKDPVFALSVHCFHLYSTVGITYTFPRNSLSYTAVNTFLQSGAGSNQESTFLSHPLLHLLGEGPTSKHARCIRSHSRARDSRYQWDSYSPSYPIFLYCSIYLFSATNTRFCKTPYFSSPSDWRRTESWYFGESLWIWFGLPMAGFSDIRPLDEILEMMALEAWTGYRGCWMHYSLTIGWSWGNGEEGDVLLLWDIAILK